MPSSFTWITEKGLPFFGTVKRLNGDVVNNQLNSIIRDHLTVRIAVHEGQHYVVDDKELSDVLLAFAAVPPSRAVQTIKSVRASPSSKQRLVDLGFDPLGALVDKYLELEEASQRQYDIRDKKLSTYTSQGKPAAYYQDGHLEMTKMQIDIAKALLKYAAAPVPVEVNVNETIPTFEVILDSVEYFDVMATEVIEHDNDSV